MDYASLLLRREWLAKRKEIIEEYGGQCHICRMDDKPLHIHHSLYISGRLPWEYANYVLYCLCYECHAKQHPGGSSAHIPRYPAGWDETAPESLPYVILAYPPHHGYVP